MKNPFKVERHRNRNGYYFRNRFASLGMSNIGEKRLYWVNIKFWPGWVEELWRDEKRPPSHMLEIWRLTITSFKRFLPRFLFRTLVMVPVVFIGSLLVILGWLVSALGYFIAQDSKEAKYLLKEVARAFSFKK